MIRLLAHPHPPIPCASKLSLFLCDPPKGFYLGKKLYVLSLNSGSLVGIKSSSSEPIKNKEDRQMIKKRTVHRKKKKRKKIQNDKLGIIYMCSLYKEVIKEQSTPRNLSATATRVLLCTYMPCCSFSEIFFSYSHLTSPQLTSHLI